MDGDWDEVGRLLLPPHGPQHISSPVSSIVFDNSQELLWLGNQHGRVSSFYSSELQRYTSFKAGDGLVQQLLVHDKGIIAVCSSSVHMAMRRGPPIWHISHEDMKDLRCVSYTSKGTSEIVVAGLLDYMFTIDVDKGIITKQIPTKEHYTLLRRSRYICAATPTGTVNILDSITFNCVKTWVAHTAMINDMDAQHDFIVTCGYSLRQQTQYMLDPLVNVFDLKNMTSLSPIPFPAGAAFVRMHPRMSTTSIIASQLGQIHVVDLMNVNTSNVRQANVYSPSHLTMMEIAPSGEALALADSECQIHLWGAISRIRFPELSNQVEFADSTDEQPQLDWSVDTPLSSIGMPYYREQLLSAWPNNMVFDVGGPAVKIDPKVLSSLRVHEYGRYGPNARSIRRNQVESTRQTEKMSSRLQAPKFLSEKARETGQASQGRRKSEPAEAIENNPYANVEVKYSKFGFDDFDFSYYNSTKYSGLDTHIPNSYANSLLQVLHFTPLIRNIALYHTATACIDDACLLCELGFLFDMLEKAEGSVCQATNLLKTLTHNPQVAKLNLLEESKAVTLGSMLQGLSRFFMDKIAHDFRTMSNQADSLDQALATSAAVTIRCLVCATEYPKVAVTFVHDLIYPQTNSLPRGARNPRFPFSQILKASVEREANNRGWCNTCRRYQPNSSRKTIHNVPHVLMLNAMATTPEAKQFWATPGWLPAEIGVIVDRLGQFHYFEGEDLQNHIHRGAHDITIYSLVGLAAEITSEQEESHLVSLINVAHSQPSAPAESQWHIFNDFLVKRMTSTEALTFDTSWKLPSIITYQAKIRNNKIDDSWKRNLDTSLIYTDYNSGVSDTTYHVLDYSHEAPQEGTIIALDTEFVKIKDEEIGINPEGVLHIVRPAAFALARVSVVRGSGEDEELPFIDDYIASKEPILDHLTSYSGIQPGDLDTRKSTHNLVSLKFAYKKLWILLNLGCKFLGHGLKTDFRVINIQVPKSQVIDTSELFPLKGSKRKLSLAFLAYCLLQEQIQLETHDSIEDARTALRLYKKYLEYEDAGILETILLDVAKQGSMLGYKPPPAIKDGHIIERTETPPIMGDGSAIAAGASNPTTPVRKAIGLALGAGSPLSGSGWTPGKSSGLGGSHLR